MKYLGVAVALIDCRICAEEIKIALAVCVPYKRALAAFKHYGDGCVVVCSIALLAINDLH